MPWYEYSVTSDGKTQPLVTVHLWHGSRRVQVIALVDSGADTSAMDASYAEVLGLDRADAESREATTAGGTTVRTLRWPKSSLEIQFENERFPFNGVFVEFPKDADPLNLLGRRDFFQRYVIQFWDAADMMNIDTSPDYPKPAPAP